MADKPSPRGRKFVRSVGPREHYLGVGILALVMLFCTWLLIYGLAPKGRLWGHYDASLFSGQAATGAASSPVSGSSSAGPGSDQAEKALTDDEGAYSDGEGAYSDGEGAVATTAASGERPKPEYLPLAAPGGWSAGPVETFSADTLYEKIDGRAEAYTAFGVTAMECASYTGGQPAGSVDVFIYDMGRPLQAFGMFGSERSGDEARAAFGQMGYQASGSIYFWQDRFYVQVVPGSGSEAEAKVAQTLAAAAGKALPAGKLDIPALQWFPPDGLQSDSIRYVMSNALGLDWLHDVYTARYEVDGVRVDAFLCRRPSEADAADVLDGYRKFLASMGKVSGLTLGGTEATLGDQSGMIDIVFRRGTTVGGVTYVEGRAPAEKVARRLAEAVKG